MDESRQTKINGNILSQVLNDDDAQTIIEGDVKAGMGNESTIYQSDKEKMKQIEAKSQQKPHLSPEQEEWLEKVFIPNFRRELMNNMKAVDMKPSDSRSNKSAGIKGVPHDKSRTTEDALRNADDERERLMGIISELKIDRELVASASKHNSVNPAQVAQLLRNHVRLNEDMTPVVLDGDGKPAVNSEGNLITIDEQVKEFLANNPHFVKATGPYGGSGSGDSLAGDINAPSLTGGDLIAAGLRDEDRKMKYARRR